MVFNGAEMAGLAIFDCDGVLVDSDRISLRIQAERITALGLPMSYEDCVREFLGLGMPATLRLLAERLGEPLPRDWEKDLDLAVREAFRRELRPVPGISEALDAIEADGVPICVASSGSLEKMRLTLGLTDLWSRFEGRIYSGEEVAHGKPAPDLFLLAAARMEVPAERCIVIEDSPFGVAGARAAGMKALGYAPGGDGEMLADAGAEVFASMAGLPDLLSAARSSPGPGRRPG